MASIVFEDRYYPTTEAARMLGISPAALKNWARIGLVTPVRIGPRRLMWCGMQLQNQVRQYRAVS